MEMCFLGWGVDKVFTITVDSGSSNDLAMSYLRKRSLKWGTSFLDGKFLHMRCIEHIFNLIVVDGLKEVGSSAKQVREAMRFDKQDPYFKIDLIEEDGSNGIHNDDD
ncbi:hypothetical protein GH714_005931 [Hevea brasiliensis]|uniref:hAT-like transposase RNase-H fold domain-containing protein n=1 Tax=Hevea brasiliensis TaxID=3981 RepID=A0A6A6M8B0_HEVBR|nr:hypothetical protein GH714_005931 [Hevea brasiliensis]